jgi:hypothetical protein
MFIRELYRDIIVCEEGYRLRTDLLKVGKTANLYGILSRWEKLLVARHGWD